MLKACRIISYLKTSYYKQRVFCSTSAAKIIESSVDTIAQDVPPMDLYDKFKGFRNQAIDNLFIPGVTIVNSREKALKALDVLNTLDDRLFLIN